jgi:RNA polymerase-interacting CarD/CdnL/TRCF family regulator
MQFQVGGRIVHPVYGIGHIAAIPERQFSEGEMGLYYQICWWAERYVWLPVESQESSRLRLITVRSLDQFRILLKSPPVTL